MIPVAGQASDAEGPVTVSVNGAPATVEEDGSFSGAADLATDDPGLVVFEAMDRAGNTTRVEVRVEILAPEVALVRPAPGALIGERVIDLSGRSGTATEVGVNGVAAQVPGDGTFSLPGFDLGEDGLVTLTLEGSNCGGSVRATATLDLDTLAPTVAIDSPSEGTLFGSQPITVSGTVEDAHLETVTVNGVAATVDGGRFTAEGVPLAEGDDLLVATATDALGRSTASAPVTVTLDTHGADGDDHRARRRHGPGHADAHRLRRGLRSPPGRGPHRGRGGDGLRHDLHRRGRPRWRRGTTSWSPRRPTWRATAPLRPSVVVVLDTLPPEVSLDADALPELTGETAISVSGTAVDPHLDAVSPSTGSRRRSPATGSSPTRVPLEEGANALVAEAVDSLDHRATSAPVTVTRDTLAPEVVITEPAAGRGADRAHGDGARHGERSPPRPGDRSAGSRRP